MVYIHVRLYASAAQKCVQAGKIQVCMCEEQLYELVRDSGRERGTGKGEKVVSHL